MGKFCIEEITMGFLNPTPKSIFYGHFETQQEAIKWAKNKYDGWTEIDDDSIFFQKDFSISVKESYIRNCEDNNFLKYSTYIQSIILSV